MAQQTSQERAPDPDEETVTPVPEQWHPVVLGMIASGLLELSNVLQRQATFPTPYPATLQRALDRMTVMAMTADVEVPRSVMDLAAWAHCPFSEWPFRPYVEGMTGDEVLLVKGTPSKACLEWAVISGDVEGEIRERLLIHGVLDACKADNDQNAYVNFRALLVEKPAMSEQDLAFLRSDAKFTLLAEEIRSAYQPAPAEALIDGEALICAGCKNLWTLDLDGARRCQEWDCPDPSRIETRLPAAEGVVWLRRELRMFISGPGRAELRIADALRRHGLNVHLWPGFDACDILPESVPWAADVKSWTNPVRLAWRLTERPFIVPDNAERGYIVIAQEQTRGRPEYIRALRNHCSWLKKASTRVEVVTEKTYIDRVVAEARKRQS
ncbi:pPIWI_RE_Y domain-containing protein [Allokutzneria oryzae]|uniref:REase associating with pPIWI RE domain-containing protein n=1 Tax=Allokutzneria oryzae TaxID=1378989 RepID=A0ABV5ZPR2_9PSEU